MPLRVAKKGDNVIYRNTRGETQAMVVTGSQQTAPATPGSSTSTTGGTLAAATYSYRVSAVVDGIETLASTAKTQITTGTTSTVTVTWVAVPGATSHKVYGRTGGSELLMATVAMPTLQFIDDATVTPAGALPAATTAIRLWSPYVAQLTAIAKATTMDSVNAYFFRY